VALCVLGVPEILLLKKLLKIVEKKAEHEGHKEVTKATKNIEQ